MQDKLSKTTKAKISDELSLFNKQEDAIDTISIWEPHNIGLLREIVHETKFRDKMISEISFLFHTADELVRKRRNSISSRMRKNQ